MKDRSPSLSFVLLSRSAEAQFSQRLFLAFVALFMLPGLSSSSLCLSSLSFFRLRSPLSLCFNHTRAFPTSALTHIYTHTHTHTHSSLTAHWAAAGLVDAEHAGAVFAALRHVALDNLAQAVPRHGMRDGKGVVAVASLFCGRCDLCLAAIAGAEGMEEEEEEGGAEVRVKEQKRERSSPISVQHTRPCADTSNTHTRAHTHAHTHTHTTHTSTQPRRSAPRRTSALSSCALSLPHSPSRLPVLAWQSFRPLRPCASWETPPWTCGG